MKRFLFLIGVFAALVACKKDYYGDPPDGFGPPEIRLRVLSPRRADSTAWFVFSGAGSRDADGLWGIIDFRWDLNGDGIWDTPFTGKSDWVHVFPETGQHIIILQVADRFGQTSVDSITITTYGAITDTSHFTDPRDGQVYKTVRIAGLGWMAENLNYGEFIPVTDTVVDDGITQKYSYMDDPKAMGELGGYYAFYDWMELMNHDTTSIVGICPPGWEIPNRDDWMELIGLFPFKYYAEGGFSNLNLTRTGIHSRLQEWLPVDLSEETEPIVYLTRDFYKGYMNGPDKILPYIMSSQESSHYLADSGNLYAMPYANNSIKKHMGIAPVRCVKRD